MVLDLGVSSIPMPVFMAVHLTALAVAAVLAVRSAARGAPAALRTAFVLFAAAEVAYMGYHLEVTTFLLSHTVAEALDLVAFVLAFVGFGQQAMRPAPARTART